MSVARLRAFAYAPVESRCDLCGQLILERHEHVLERQSLRCACAACAVLFGDRRVIDQVHRLDAATISDEEWARLALPIQLAFFVNTSARGQVVAFYPSVAGAIEAPVGDLNLDLRPDVEALLVDRRRAPACYRVSIDHCHRLTGLLKAHWRGLGGGEVVWTELERFFVELDKASRA